MDIQYSGDSTSAEAVDNVFLTQLIAGDAMSVQHFRIEPGAVVPEHSHPHEQVGYLLQGELTFITDDGEHVVQTGDSYALAGDETHAAENRGDETVVGIDVFSPPRVNPDWQDD